MKPSVDDPLEKLLEKLEAAPPSAGLMARLKAAGPPETLESPATRPVPQRARGATILRLFIPAAAAAAVVALATLAPRAPEPDSTPAKEKGETVAKSGEDAKVDVKIVDAALLPLRESHRKLIDLRSLGTVKDDLQRPVELLRAVWLDENVYDAPGLPEGVRETARREEIVPVLLQTQ